MVSESKEAVQVDSVVTHHYQLSNGLAAGSLAGDDFAVGLQDSLQDGRYFVAESLTIIGAESPDWTVNAYGQSNLLELSNIHIAPLSQVQISIDVYIPKLDSGQIINTAYMTEVAGALGGINGQVESDHPGGLIQTQHPWMYWIPYQQQHHWRRFGSRCGQYQRCGRDGDSRC